MHKMPCPYVSPWCVGPDPDRCTLEYGHAGDHVLETGALVHKQA